MIGLLRGQICQRLGRKRKLKEPKEKVNEQEQKFRETWLKGCGIY